MVNVLTVVKAGKFGYTLYKNVQNYEIPKKSHIAIQKSKHVV